MDGRTLASGAVSSVKNIANPVTLARAVMEKVLSQMFKRNRRRPLKSKEIWIFLFIYLFFTQISLFNAKLLFCAKKGAGLLIYLFYFTFSYMVAAIENVRLLT